MKIDEVSSMTPEDGKILLKIARESVEEHILGIRKPEVRSIDTSVRQNAGVFVTLKIHGNLRGCIGFVEAILPPFLPIDEIKAGVRQILPDMDIRTDTDFEKSEADVLVVTTFTQPLHLLKISTR